MCKNLFFQNITPNIGKQKMTQKVMKNKKISEDIAYYHLHGEQVRIYEQLVSLYSNNQETNKTALQISYKLFVNALNRISTFFQIKELDFESGLSHQGTYLEFSYPIFAQLNAELPQEMEIMYGASCVHFKQFCVKLHGEIAQPLPNEVIKKYQHTLYT